MPLFKKKVDLDRFLLNAIASTFTAGFPISQVDPQHILTAEQRVDAAEILRVRSLVTHYFALVARVGRGIPVSHAELSDRYRTVLWHVLVESTRSRVEADAIATSWEEGVEDVTSRLDEGMDQRSAGLDEATAGTTRMLRSALGIDTEEYCAWAAATVTEHSVRALGYALTEVKLV